MRYSDIKIVLQEVPTEISLAFFITGCPLRCPGCHSVREWNGSIGSELSDKVLENFLQKYQIYISCVLFLGGEWYNETLVKHLKKIKELGFKTALYTGLNKKDVPIEILKNLDYLKYGSYQQQLGGLSSSMTNQNLINVHTNESLNKYFLQGGFDDSAERSANQ
ncbi:MAG: anaerobic ribonucleoside-triphosphate reductase activating protein [Bdellovibrionaceae bacterium]|nr:anaerobic ribonucleoside-triphosphate reductase activating protein [Pseudobdellovibrionaceae bacterium]